MVSSRLWTLYFLSACAPATQPDTVDVSCVEQSRVPYAESHIESPLTDYVAMYLELEGAWFAQLTCVGGGAEEVGVEIVTASQEEMEVATYEGSSCGALAVGVVANTSAALDATIVSVPDVRLSTSLAAGDAWAVAIMDGTAADGTSVLIEMAADGELRGSTMKSEVSGNDQETQECTLTNWHR